jgi:hypothetical protein
MHDESIRPGQPNRPRDPHEDAITERPADVIPAELVDEDGEPIMAADLANASWLRRQFAVSVPRGQSLIEYDGRGFGFESVNVDGLTVRSETSFWWFVPEFKFRVRGYRALIKVRVWPWLAIKSFELWVDGRLLYHEGPEID